MISIAIVEDQKKDADMLSGLICSYADRHGITCEVKLFADGVSFMTGYKPLYDIVFMDIQMPLSDGMSIAHKLREVDDSVSIVFVTNMRQYAVNGYEVNAVDFIIKPISRETFEIKFGRILRVAEQSRSSEIMITTKSEAHRVKIGDIDYVDVTNHKCVYHLRDRDIESWDSLSRIYETLKNHGFCYCNSCYLVNLDHVDGIEGDNVIIRGNKLKISRAKRRSFLFDLAQSLSVRS